MSKFSNWMVRTIVREEMYDCTVERLNLNRPVLSTGIIKVHTSAGGERELQLDEIYTFDIDAVHESDTALLAMLTETWPETTEYRPLHPFKDGLSLCDVAHFLRNEGHGISLLAFGQIKGWWRVVHDEHIVCRHAEAGLCPQYCTLYIDRVNQPPRRPKKKRERLSDRIKIKLPELALPRPGFALG